MSNMIVVQEFHSLAFLERREIVRSKINAVIGRDKIWYLVNGIYVRRGMLESEWKYSLIDCMTIVSDSENTPRRYWSDKKKALLGRRSELSEKIGQLKLASEDGKMYKTDVSPFWGVMKILSRMDTPIADEIIDPWFKAWGSAIEAVSDAELRYRARNIENGSEWRADTIHALMATLSPPEYESPDEEMGYRR